MNSDSTSDPLSKLGEMLMTNVRDKSIQQHDMLLAGRLRGKGIHGLQSRVAVLLPEQKALLREVVIDSLDVALHGLLHALQEAHDCGTGVELSVDQVNVAEASGTLQAEPLGPNGWINRFSRYPATGTCGVLAPSSRGPR